MKKVLAVLTSVLLIMAMAVNVSACYDFTEDDFQRKDSEVILSNVEICGIETKISITSDEDRSELIECIKKDRESIPEDEIKTSGWGFEVRVDYIEYYESEFLSSYLRCFYIDPQHTNTIRWIKDNGYWDDIEIKKDAPVYIIKNPGYIPYMDFWDMEIKLDMNIKEVVKKFEGEEIASLCEFAYGTIFDDEAEFLNTYLVYQEAEKENHYRYVTTFSEDQLKELMK